MGVCVCVCVCVGGGGLIFTEAYNPVKTTKGFLKHWLHSRTDQDSFKRVQLILSWFISRRAGGGWIYFFIYCLATNYSGLISGVGGGGGLLSVTLACEQGVRGEGWVGDGRKEVRALCHEVGHLVLFLIYLVMVIFLTDLSVNKAPFHLDEIIRSG